MNPSAGSGAGSRFRLRGTIKKIAPAIFALRRLGLSLERVGYPFRIPGQEPRRPSVDSIAS